MSNSLRLAVVALCAFFIGAGVARSDAPFVFPAPKKFSVGSTVPARVLRGTSITGGNYTITRNTTCLYADGSQSIGIIYANANGQTVSTKTLTVDSGCTKVVDNFGNVVSLTGPTTECNAAATFTGQEDTTLGSAATNGKLNL